MKLSQIAQVAGKGKVDPRNNKVNYFPERNSMSHMPCIARLVLGVSLVNLDSLADKLTDEQKSVVSLILKLVNSKTHFEVEALVSSVIEKICDEIENIDA